jgi:hypothetical protein
VQNAFKEWWSLYPNRKSKGAARTVYEGIINKKKATVEQLKLGAMRYAASVTDRESKFIKYPATWLRGECWLDEPDKQPAGTDTQPSIASGGNGWAKVYRKFGG